MKKILIALTIMTFAFAVSGQITGSAHDFSDDGWTPNQEICIACHTPHNADTTVTDSPLWNHEVTTAVYTLYNSNSLNAVVGQPDGISKLCLSCHDGTVAIDSFGGATGSNFVTGNDLLGTSLNGEHPISFSYQQSIDNGDGGLHPTTASTTLGGTIATDLLSGGNVECSSCHDVHNAYGNNHLLKITNTQSTLCFTCHDK